MGYCGFDGCTIVYAAAYKREYGGAYLLAACLCLFYDGGGYLFSFVGGEQCACRLGYYVACLFVAKFAQAVAVALHFGETQFVYALFEVEEVVLAYGYYYSVVYYILFAVCLCGIVIDEQIDGLEQGVQRCAVAEV